jgi:VCBS repeat-containing protein
VAVNDSYNATRNTLLTIPVGIGVLANDSDVDGNPLSVTVLTGPAHGTLTLNADGSFSFNPTTNYTGSDSFTYRVSDGSGGTATATVTLNIANTNTAPVATNDSYTTNEDTTLNVPAGTGVLSNDTDANGDPLVVTGIVTGPTHGTVSLNANGSFTYTPVANYNGADSFTYQVSDSRGGTATATVNLTVNPVDDAPTAVNDTATVNESIVNPTLNVTIVLDVSGSMGSSPGASGFATRLDLAAEAIRQMLDSYDNVGPVNVLVVAFDSNAYTSGWLTGPNSTALANGYINGLAPGSNTNYSAAINLVEATYSVNTPTADKSVVYFISDGEPTAGQSLTDTGGVGAWETFLNNNNIDTALAFGINNSPLAVNLSALEDIAYPNDASDSNPAILSNELQIIDTLVENATPPNAVSGDVDANDNYGGDGAGYVQSIVIDGTTYTYNPSGAGQVSDGINPPISGSLLVVTTALGGQLQFNFGNGTYTYTAPAVASNATQTFNYTIVDSNGTPSSATLTINISNLNRAPVVDSRTLWVPDALAQLPAAYSATGYPLLIAAPTDADGNTLTVTVTAVPTEGTTYYDATGSGGWTVLTAGTALTVAQLTGLRYRPDGDGVQENLTLNYSVNDGSNTTNGTVAINTLAGATFSVTGVAQPRRR